MSFLNPLFWFGIAALAAPVLVHLVRRTRARRVQFPALVFVRQVPQRTIRRRTLQNLLLLILRCLAILLIVLAFTRPFFTGRSAARNETSSGATVILIDTSLSMQRDQLFAAAQKRAEALVDEARTNELLAVMRFGKTYETISRFSSDKARARTATAALSAGWEGTDLEQALRGADSLLNELNTSTPKRIFLISDFQASGWNRSVATFKLSSTTQLTTIDVSESDPPGNVAITNVEAKGIMYGQKYSENLTVHITNFADIAKDHVLIDFQINDQTVEKRDISLNARESKVVEFTNFNLNEGTNRCTIDIATDDFKPDNHFYFTLRREPPGKALIVETPSRGRDDSFYLQSALTTNDALPFSFTSKTAGAVDPASIPEYGLVILNDSGPLSPSLSNSLVRFVEGGGQLIVALGPHTDVAGFNTSLQTIAPATLREPVQTRPTDAQAITDVKFDHPIFSVFQESGRLASARLFGFVRSEPKTGAAVLARVEDGTPALIESRFGKGRVVMFASTLGPAWNDLALTPLYLPFVHQLVRYTADRNETAWYALGQTLAIARGTQPAPPSIDTPSGKRLNDVRSAANGDLLFTAREPGFYRLRYETQPSTNANSSTAVNADYSAVDIDGNEGNFSKIDFQEFIAATSGGAGSQGSSEANRKASNDETESRQRVWWSLLLVALLLLLSESVLARRTRVSKMVG